MQNQESNLDEILLQKKRKYFKEYSKTYFQLNKERVLKYRQEYYLKHIERLTASYKERYCRMKGSQETRPYNKKEKESPKPDERTNFQTVDKIVVTFR